MTAGPISRMLPRSLAERHDAHQHSAAALEVTHRSSHEDEVTGEVHYVGGAHDARPNWKRNRPAGDVMCEVSGRWLRFHPESSKSTGEEFIHVDVMTTIETDSGSRERKLCALIVTREDVMRALDTVRPR